MDWKQKKMDSGAEKEKLVDEAVQLMNEYKKEKGRRSVWTENQLINRKDLMIDFYVERFSSGHTSDTRIRIDPFDTPEQVLIQKALGLEEYPSDEELKTKIKTSNQQQLQKLMDLKEAIMNKRNTAHLPTINNISQLKF